MDQSLRKVCRIARRATGFVRFLQIVYALYLAGCIVWMALLPDGRGTLEVMGKLVYPPSSPEQYPEMIAVYSGSLVFTALLIVALSAARALFCLVESAETPFTKQSVSLLKKTALFVGLMGILPAVGSAIVAACLGAPVFYGLDFLSALDGSSFWIRAVATLFAVPTMLLIGGTTPYAINYVYIIVALALYVLTHIFVHGVRLQRQDDETL